MKKISLAVTGALALVAGLYFMYEALYLRTPLMSPTHSNEIKQYVRILDKYAFNRLRAKTPVSSEITIEKTLKQDPLFTAYLFSFLSDGKGKKVTGQLNIPKVGKNLPVIVMVRGFVSKDVYATGIGTQRASEAFARAGYITIAPDFLGFAGSDEESFDLFEARFEKPSTVINLIASLGSIPQADSQKIGLWGHSNGGQISLSVLEISQEQYPTTLWAPVTQAFPDSIMEYVDELPDKGQYIKNQLSIFRERYTDEDYSIASHWSDISAPIHVHQGGADDAVPEEYTRSFYETLKGMEKNITYFTYPREDHNFNQGSFTTMIARDLQLFNTYLR